MPHCAVVAGQWKNRQAYRLQNSKIEITVLPGGGHIADLRLHGSPINALWESPWPTIEPQTFSSREHAGLYGDGPVGRFLSGYTGHALALGYFGMPSSEEAKRGLALHGEASVSEWTIVSAAADDDSAALVMEVTLPVYRLHVRREICLSRDAFSACITEIVTNFNGTMVDFQWVEHAAFGEPFFVSGEATLSVSGTRGVTWPLGYEGHELLASGVEYKWPYAQSVDGGSVDLSQPFVRGGTGFVAALLAASDHDNAFVAVHSRRHHLVAGYCFNSTDFPWIALWEENRARAYAPWNNKTRVRGVEFGTSPLPLGLAHSQEMGRLFGTPVFRSVSGSSSLEAQYDLFLHSTPAGWSQITDVRKTEHSLTVRGDSDEEIVLQRGKGRV
jgi:hypothetical protein